MIDYTLKERLVMNLLTTKKAAAILGLTPDAIRYHERQGHILAIKVDRGEGDFMRLFIREDIERFRRRRAEKSGKLQ
jgi:DNA-binding transcriptional MerR regulator